MSRCTERQMLELCDVQDTADSTVMLENGRARFRHDLHAAVLWSSGLSSLYWLSLPGVHRKCLV